MPLFEYQCQECDAKIEIIQRVGARALKKTECDECGVVRPVQKLLSAPAFQFKGEGWYVTDYADKKNQKPDAKSDGSSSDGDSSDGGSASSSDSSAKSDKSAKGSSETASGSKARAKDPGTKSSPKSGGSKSKKA